MKFASVSFLEVEIGQIHIASSENMNGEDALSGRQAQLHDRWHVVPVVPLPPGNGVGRIEG